MASEKTLREVCENLNITRRVVQGYEKAGLVHATGKNKYGHLLYDEETQNRIARIRFYQSMGFRLKEIKVLTEVSREEAIRMIQKQKDHLTAERNGIEKIIKQVEILLSDF